ncbi:hypothetical protein AGABI1DRAFT_116193 [Agaricus bisporus var. burnettii JB137-S8]|uniref:Uncharacterized protein n=2 Tax=Agaricus bisporus var. burnettii TaxID=192524 RepID=K5WK97_AGABU|nr:uncharacterized protein AGABI1DRAFT_116193 [Agaricus bisporus var. burnettii JB137-S8]EKM75711.1 hypothetical protein AGABI1DRAFT_116193 [Agaricus bisporus var. burnettii JB137-S8]KAF7776435.1 hypothetical protein Agabi119p4_4828 [Agaricus bisporus var. burnettii]
MPASSENLETIFARVEQSGERRPHSPCQELEEHEHVAALSVSTSRSNTSMSIRKDRRRGSISISRFGQMADSQPTSPALTPIAAHSSFYKAQAANMSDGSIASGASNFSDERAHTEDHTQITQVQTIAGKPGLSRAVSSILPKRLSRTQSVNVFVPPTELNLVIGVSIHESRTESPASETLQLGTTATVSALGNQLNNKNSRRSLTANTKWLAKAKSYMQNIGHKAA